MSLFAALPFVILYAFFGKADDGAVFEWGEQDAIEAGVLFLRIVSPMYFMIAVKLMTDGIIRGAGAMKYFVIATVPDLILRICMAELLTPHFGSTGIWLAFPAAEFLTMIVGICFYRQDLKAY